MSMPVPQGKAKFVLCKAGEYAEPSLIYLKTNKQLISHCQSSGLTLDGAHQLSASFLSEMEDGDIENTLVDNSGNIWEVWIDIC